jgi:hypothetical protein
MINQLPVSSAIWQLGSSICFATFNLGKIAKALLIPQQMKLEKKIHKSLILAEF